MPGKGFKAITIVAPDVGSRMTLLAAFNAWAEEAQPADIKHIHYYHDPESHTRGYQIIYEESRGAVERPVAPRAVAGASLNV